MNWCYSQTHSLSFYSSLPSSLIFQLTREPLPKSSRNSLETFWSQIDQNWKDFLVVFFLGKKRSDLNFIGQVIIVKTGAKLFRLLKWYHDIFVTGIFPNGKVFLIDLIVADSFQMELLIAVVLQMLRYQPTHFEQSRF